MIEPTNRLKAAYMRLVERLTPRCHDITRLLSEAQDRPLSLRVRLLIRWHYSVCVWCERYADHLALLRTLLRKFPEDGCRHAHVSLHADARRRLSARVEQALQLPEDRA